MTNAPLKLVFALTALVAGSLPAAASDPSSGQLPAQQIDDLLADVAAQGGSGVLRIASDGDVLYEAGFGSAHCDGRNPVTPAHIFMIGSITKEFTRLLAYVLEEQGELSRTDTLGQRIPNLGGPIAGVNIQQVLDHEAGLPDLIDEHGEPVPYSIDYDYVPVSRDQLIERASRAGLIYEPGSDEQYSNLGYQLLAALYEETTGESYEGLLRQYIFEPAGMNRTGFWFDDVEPDLLVEGCRRGGATWGNPVRDRMWDEGGPSWNLVGAGGLLSTAASLGAFLDGIGGGVYFETDTQSEQYKSDRMVFSERRQQRVMGPAGSNGIFNAVAVWRDGDRTSIVLMTNRADHTAESGLIQDIAGLVP